MKDFTGEGLTVADQMSDRFRELLLDMAESMSPRDIVNGIDVDGAADVLLGRIAAKPQWADRPTLPGPYLAMKRDWESPELVEFRDFSSDGRLIVIHRDGYTMIDKDSEIKWLRLPDVPLPFFEEQS